MAFGERFLDVLYLDPLMIEETRPGVFVDADADGVVG